jgi:hypothetical protein
MTDLTNQGTPQVAEEATHVRRIDRATQTVDAEAARARMARRNQFITDAFRQFAALPERSQSRLDAGYERADLEALSILRGHRPATP